MYFKGLSSLCKSSISLATKTLMTGTNILDINALKGTESSPIKWFARMKHSYLYKLSPSGFGP
jgi:hypothetical protein